MGKRGKIGVVLAGLLGLVVTGAVALFLLLGTGNASVAEYEVGNLTCGACAQKITRALDALPGVGKVDVDIAGGTTRVEFDPSRSTTEKIRQAIAGAGYPASYSRTFSGDRSALTQGADQASPYVARIGQRLVSREEFEGEVARLQQSTSASTPQTVGPALRRLVWAQMLERLLWLADAQRSGVTIAEGEIAREMDRLRQGADFPARLARAGGEQNLALQIREEFTIQRHLQQNVLGETSPAQRQGRLDQRWKELSRRIPVELFDPTLKAGTPRSGGCGGSCCS